MRSSKNLPLTSAEEAARYRQSGIWPDETLYQRFERVANQNEKRVGIVDAKRSYTYGELLDYVIFAALLFYALTVAGLFILRRTQPDAPRPYRAFGYPLLPGLYVVLCTAVMFIVPAGFKATAKHKPAIGKTGSYR